MLSITVFLKDGGYKEVTIPLKFLSPLAEAIKERGFEYVTLQSGVLTIVGFLVRGVMTGERVIVLGIKDSDLAQSASESTEILNEV
jgi:hypothetical protein